MQFNRAISRNLVMFVFLRRSPLTAFRSCVMMRSEIENLAKTLSTREDDELYLNKAEQAMMASEQRMLVGKMHGLARVIFGFAVLAAILFAATAGLWV